MTGNARTNGRHGATRRNTLDETAFDVVTPESAYWVGFLMAAGSITRAGTRSPAIAVTTADEDRAHLERFRGFVRAMDPITVGTRDGFRDASRAYLSVQVRSARLARTLARFGVVPYKTLVAKAFELECDRHFWRGCIDGDGSISRHGEDDRTGPVVSFGCRSRELVRQFADFARQAIPGCVVEEDTRTPKAYCVIHSVTLRGSDCVEMARVLYGDGEIALPRKRDVAFDMLRDHGVLVEEAPADVAPLIESVAHVALPLTQRTGSVQRRLF
jgi:hypothetical protein